MTPNEWQKDSLKNVLNKVIDYRGQSVPKSETGIPLITARNVREGYLDFSIKEFVAENEYENWMARGIPQAGDVLFTTEAPLGMVAMYPFDNKRYAVGQRIITLRPSKILDSQFLMYYLIGPGRKEIQERASGSTAKGIKSSELKKVSISFPSVVEQRKIAKILSTWDEAIEKIALVIKYKEQKKRHVLEKCFAEIIAKKQFKNLSELADVLPSNVDKKTNEGEQFVRLCNYSDVYKNNKITEDIDFMKATASPSEIAKFRVRKDDVIITKDSETPQDIAIPSFVEVDIQDLVCGYHLTMIRCDTQKIIGHYLYYYFLTAKSRYYFFTMANGVTRFGLSIDAIKDCQIPIIDLATQKKIVLSLEAIEHEIGLFKSYQNSLQQQKLGLMQQLLTGKKRVKV